MSKKVLMTASSFEHIRHFHLPYLKAFQEQGWMIHLACGGQPEAFPYADKEEPIPLKKNMLAFSNLKAAFQLRKLIRRENYDLIIMHTSLAAFFTRLALMGMRKRPYTINVVHGYLFDDKTPFIKRTVLSLAELFCKGVTDKILVMNQWDLAWARKHRAASKIVLIPGMGIDFGKLRLRKEQPGSRPSDGKVKLIYTAEFSWRKNQAMLIRALTKLPEQVSMILPGQGALLEKCKQLAAELLVEERVSFPGYVRNAANLLDKADIFVTASRIEGLPFCVMEAMAYGKPVIASKVKGHADLVQDGVNGFLYEYDNETKFIPQVKKLLDSRELREQLGKQGRSIVEKYELSSVLPAVMQAYLDKPAAVTGA